LYARTTRIAKELSTAAAVAAAAAAVA